MNKFFFKNKNGDPSITLTMFILGCLVVNAKLIASGLIFTYADKTSLTFGAFTGIEYAAAIAALGGVYVLRRSSDKNNDKKDGE